MKLAERKPRIRAFFLSYYRDKAEHGLAQFMSLLGFVGGEPEIYFIDNGGNGPVSLPASVRYVEGDNSRWEFSGWDAGIRQARAISDDDLCIFCNDTFCFHREWSDFERARFVRCFEKLRNVRKPGLAGEFCSFNEDFDLNGACLRGWVSTYLFGMTGTLLNLMESKLTLPEQTLNQLFVTIKNNRIVWGKEMDPSLAAHISNWLFPAAGAVGWYQSANASDELKVGKVRAILNEKYIASCCARHRGSIVQTNPTLFMRGVRKVTRGTVYPFGTLKPRP